MRAAGWVPIASREDSWVDDRTALNWYWSVMFSLNLGGCEVVVRVEMLWLGCYIGPDAVHV